jgi:hypothetical protein
LDDPISFFGTGAYKRLMETLRTVLAHIVLEALDGPNEVAPNSVQTSRRSNIDESLGGSMMTKQISFIGR